MTTLTLAFKKAASKVIDTFTEDVAPCAYYSLLDTTSYDPVSGVVTPDYLVVAGVNIAFGSFTDEAVFPEHFTNDHVKAFISGETFSVVPKEGDKIILADGTIFLLDNGFTATDMYKALYTVYLKEVFV